MCIRDRLWPGAAWLGLVRLGSAWFGVDRFSGLPLRCRVAEGIASARLRKLAKRASRVEATMAPLAPPAS
eukprot:9227882-Alexandrium_andersonii.AAC.1